MWYNDKTYFNSRDDYHTDLMRFHVEKRWTVCISVYSQIDYSHLFNCESTAKICQHACSRRFKKLNFCDIRVIVLLQSYVIMLVGRLQGTEIKWNIFWPKSDRGSLRNLSSGRLQESFWRGIMLRNKTSISTKWSLSGWWLLTGSGRY